MSRKSWNIITIFIFIIAFIFSTWFVNRTLKDKDHCTKYKRFYKEESFDVLFFGSSRMLDDIQPMEIWEDYGITSYNMAMHSESLNVTYWQMKNAFKYHVPKVAVIDVSLFHNTIIIDESSDEDKAYLHKSLDHMPLSGIKIDAIKALTDDYSHFDYYFPLEVYHNRWNELQGKDFVIPKEEKMGSEVRLKYTDVEKDDKSDDGSGTDDISDCYVDEIIELCRENGVTPVFTVMPAAGVFTGMMLSIEDYCKRNDVAFYNINVEEDVLNYHTDFADTSHLNTGGARKISGLMGEYLTQNFVFDEKNQENVAKWEAAEHEYISDSKKNDILSLGDSSVPEFLQMFIAEDDYDFCVVVNDVNFLDNNPWQEFFGEIGTENFIIDESLEMSEIRVYEKGFEEPFCIKPLW